MNNKYLLLCLFAVFCLSPAPSVFAKKSIVDSRHNLSATGPGDIRALEEDRICIFCHTPHHAEPQTPLWNRAITDGINYQTYDSTTFNVSLSQPSGPSRLCLSCHDGTVGLGAVLKGASGGIAMNMELTGRLSNLGTDLRDDHPFSFSYDEARQMNQELRPIDPTTITVYNGDVIHCSTCHDPHDDSFGMFLAVDNNYSGLCMICHEVLGWQTSAHAMSSNTWSGTGENPWPLNARLALEHQRDTVSENGCENCHTPHNAGGPMRLMNYLEEEKNCTFACHNGNVSDPQKNIQADLDKYYSLPVTSTTIGDASGNAHDPAEDMKTNPTIHVECQDCHDPHSVNSDPPTEPGGVSGSLANVSGINLLGTIKEPAQFEYEICFKCHGEYNPVASMVERVVGTNNYLADFALENPSFHPVVGVGTNSDVPSLPLHVPGTISLDPTIGESSIIYCSDCHSSNETPKIGGQGANGPHGSIYEGLLRENYTMGIGNTEGHSEYALCYRCHDRDVLLSDVSFQKKVGIPPKGGHSGHLHYGGASCSVCHDPHGVVDDGMSGDHTNLINFDISVVGPYPGESVPFFNDTGLFSGSCTLLCHGHSHNNVSYP